MRAEEIIRYLSKVSKSGSGWSARCPAHDDQHNSLSVGEGAEGRVLLKCHTGCENEAIVAALGLTMAALMPEREATGEPIAIYDYRNEEGKVVFQVLRFPPAGTKKKPFAQRHPDGGGGWVWNMEGVRRVPYNLPEILAADKSKIIYIVEGEKDADRVARMKHADGTPYIATCNVGGAGAWLDAYSEHFEGCTVAILPDNDKPGMAHADKVKASLARYRVGHVEIVKLPGLGPVLEKHGLDISDWLAINGNDQEKFDELIYRAFVAERDEREAIQEEMKEARVELEEKPSLNPVELVANPAIVDPVGFVAGTIFPRGTVSIVVGASGSGKSYLMQYIGEAIALGKPIHKCETAPGRVLFLSCEMYGPELKRRCREVWSPEVREQLSPSRLHFKWDFDRPEDRLDFGLDRMKEEEEVLTNFARMCEEANKPDVILIDSLSRIHHRKENDNGEMGLVMDNIERAARRVNAAIIVVHHFGKVSDFRTGMWRSRGASAINDRANDVWTVEPIAKATEVVNSKVAFEKARSTTHKPQPFDFSRETTDRVEYANEKKVDCIVFSTADHVEKNQKKAPEQEAVEPGRRSEETLSKTQDEIEKLFRDHHPLRFSIRQLRELVSRKTVFIIAAAQGLSNQGVIDFVIGPKGVKMWGLKDKLETKTEES